MTELIIRSERIRALCENKRVLDVGCCAHGELARRHSEKFLHGQIVACAREVVGVDNDAEAIKIVAAAGYPVLQGDALALSSLGLGEFDVVVAGELIEHLSCPGRFLDEAYRCLRPGGVIIVTVPNAYAFTRLKQMRKGIDDALWTHSQHTCWYSRATTRFLLERHGFQLQELAYCDLFRSNRPWKRVQDYVRMGWATGVRFSESIFAVGRKPPGASVTHAHG